MNSTSYIPEDEDIMNGDCENMRGAWGCLHTVF